MTTIRLETENRPQWRVVAETLPHSTSPPDHRKGNLELVPGNQVRWQAAGSPGWIVNYTVTFKDLATGALTWPFVEDASGTNPAPIGYTGPLVLVRGASVLLTARGDCPTLIKYDVSVTGTHPVDALDPMIIIRPMAQPPSPDGSILLAVTSAVVGAAVAAAATAYMLSN